MARPTESGLDRGRLGAGRWSNEAQLQHHAELVGDAPVLDHLPVLEAADVKYLNEGLPARGRLAEEASQVGASAALACPHLVSIHDEVLDRQAEIRKGGPQDAGHSLYPFGSVAH